MKKFSKIMESVWGDIRKKSLGLEARTERDVDTMEPNELIEYIESIYYVDNNRAKLEYEKETALLSVPFLYFTNGVRSSTGMTLLQMDSLIYDYEMNVIYIHKDSYEPILDMLKSKFNLKSYETFYYSIESFENEEASNKFFMEIIECIANELPNYKGIMPLIKKKNINESVWGDIRKKSLGKEVREEVNIDHMNPEEFYGYLYKRYEAVDPSWDIDYNDGRYIEITTLLNNKNSAWNTNYFHTKDPEGRYYGPFVCMNSDFEETFPELYKKICKTFKVTTQYIRESYKRLIISPPNGSKTTNGFYVEVIDFIIKNIDDKSKLLVKFRS